MHDLLVVCLGLYRLVLAHGLAERVHAWPPTAAAILLLALTLTLTLTPEYLIIQLTIRRRIATRRMKNKLIILK